MIDRRPLQQPGAMAVDVTFEIDVETVRHVDAERPPTFHGACRKVEAIDAVGPAQFGAEYKEDDQDSSGSNTDRTDWAVGLANGRGPWTVGVPYVNSEVEEGDGLGEDETEGFQVGGTYNLGPGVLRTGGVTIWGARDNLDDPAAENDAPRAGCF